MTEAVAIAPASYADANPVAKARLAGLAYPWLFLPGFVAETALMLCLLIGRANADKWRAQAAAQQTHG